MTRQQPLVVAALLTAVALVVGWLRLTPAPHRTGSLCGPGFLRQGARCLPDATAGCPAPLVVTDHGCDEAEHDVVRIPDTAVSIGPSDWEAEGRIKARSFTVRTFAIDRLEVSSGRACASPVFAGEAPCRSRGQDAARAAFGVRLDQARAYCAGRGGRLPTEDEWIAAAAGDRPRRYPWGDTGAVCRRAAWGLASGPCAEGADGPDTVGAHPDGATPLGVQDLAGNVAEWVGVTGDAGVAKGGSWQTRLATDLRTWMPGHAVADLSGIGFRCAYDQVP